MFKKKLKGTHLPTELFKTIQLFTGTSCATEAIPPHTNILLHGTIIKELGVYLL